MENNWPSQTANVRYPTGKISSPNLCTPLERSYVQPQTLHLTRGLCHFNEVRLKLRFLHDFRNLDRFCWEISSVIIQTTHWQMKCSLSKRIRSVYGLVWLSDGKESIVFVRDLASTDNVPAPSLRWGGLYLKRLPRQLKVVQSASRHGNHLRTHYEYEIRISYPFGILRMHRVSQIWTIVQLLRN